MTDLAAQLVDEEEGESAPLVYLDSRGYETIARGCLVDRRVPGTEGLCQAARDAQDAYTLAKAKTLAALIPGYEFCSEVRQAVIVSMCFQLGDLHGWPDFRTAIECEDYNEASQQMLFADVVAKIPSAWFKETSTRCARAAYMMRTDTWLDHGAPIPDG